MTANAAAANRALAAQPLPEQPAIVRQWYAARRVSANAAVHAFNSALRASVSNLGNPGAVAGQAAQLVDLMADSMQEAPLEVDRAYREWAAQYNAIINARNAERQARVNARQTAKVRAAACPRCFSTHPGEC